MTRKRTDWNKVKKEYLAGKKPIEICKKYNINRNTFDTQRKNGNWTNERRNFNENITRKLENKEVDRIQKEKENFAKTANELIEDLKEKIKKSKHSTDISNLSRALKSLQDVVWKSLDIPENIKHSGEVIIKTESDIKKW